MNSNISPIKENMNLFGNDDTETDSEDAEEKVRIYLHIVYNTS